VEEEHLVKLHHLIIISLYVEIINLVLMKKKYYKNTWTKIKIYKLMKMMLKYFINKTKNQIIILKKGIIYLIKVLL
jgi:hypothetical protein